MTQRPTDGPSDNRDSSPSLRLAVIGVMGKGRSHVSLLPQVRGAVLTAVVDHNPDAAEFARQVGVPFYNSAEALVRAGVADGVICAVPHQVRREVTVPCLEGGLHVLSEKPLAATPSDAAAIVAAARQHRRTLALMYQYRQRPAAKKAKALLDAGAIGNWYYAVMHHGVNRSQAYYDARAWRGTWAGEGGGVLVNQAPHPIEMMMHLVGKFPRRVIAFNSTLRHRMQTEDSSTAVLEYEGGAQVMMHADTIQLPTSEWWGIHGDRGTLRLDEDKVTLTTFDPDLPTAIASAPGTSKPALVQSTVETSRGEGEDSRHLGMIQDFVDAVRAGRDPLVGGVWALKCVELQAAIITSAMTGRAVDFPPDHAEYDKLLHRLARGVS